jgi:hypothetical protein
VTQHLCADRVALNIVTWVCEIVIDLSTAPQISFASSDRGRAYAVTVWTRAIMTAVLRCLYRQI